VQHVASAMKCLFAIAVGILTSPASGAEKDVRPVPSEIISIDRQIPMLHGQLPVMSAAVTSGMQTFGVPLNATTSQIGAVVGGSISNIGPALARPVTSSLPQGSTFGVPRTR